MSLQFMEGFGGYDIATHSDSAGDAMKLNWNQYSSVTLTAYASGSNGVRLYATGTLSSNLTPRIVGMDSDTVVVGLRYRRGDTNARLLFSFLRFGELIGAVGVLANGQLVYSTNTAGTITSDIVLASDDQISPQTWTYIEIKVGFDPSTGTVDFWINGVASGSITGADTEGLVAGPCTDLRFMENRGTDWDSTDRITDLYVDDANQLGPVEVWYQNCDTAGSESDFTPAASTNQSQVDEYGSDGDTTHNESAADADKDSLAHSDTLSADPLAIQALVMARLVAPGSAFLQVGILSDPGGTPTESLATKAGLTEDYDGVRGDIEEVDPDTAAAWTAANADAAETVYTQVA